MKTATRNAGVITADARSSSGNVISLAGNGELKRVMRAATADLPVIKKHETVRTEERW